MSSSISAFKSYKLLKIIVVTRSHKEDCTGVTSQERYLLAILPRTVQVAQPFTEKPDRQMKAKIAAEFAADVLPLATDTLTTDIQGRTQEPRFRSKLC